MLDASVNRNRRQILIVSLGLLAACFCGPTSPARSLEVSLGQATRLGGRGDDLLYSIVENPDGTVWVAGTTLSTNFPVSQDAHQPTLASEHERDLFLARIDLSTRAVLYGTYLGGSNDEGIPGNTFYWFSRLAMPQCLAVGDDGSVYLGITTLSLDFPTTPGSHQPAAPGADRNVAISKFSPTGELVYATYFGGVGHDELSSLAVDSGGRCVFAGRTTSPGLGTEGALQSVPALDPGDDGFVARLNADGSAIDYCSYLSGRQDDMALGICIDDYDRPVVIGATHSDYFLGDASEVGSFDVFVVRLDSSGSRLEGRVLFGGESYDFPTALEERSSGDFVVTGLTQSDEFPGVEIGHLGGDMEGFAGLVDLNRSTFECGIVLRGDNSDIIRDVAIMDHDRILVTGGTYSSTFPLSGPLQAFRAGSSDFFASVLDLSLGTLNWSTYYGSPGFDISTSCAMTVSGDLLVAGYSHSSQFPFTNEIESSSTLPSDGYIVRLIPSRPASMTNVYPQFGGNKGFVTVTIRGSELHGVENLSLVGAQSTRPASSIGVEPDGTILRATLDLDGLQPGDYLIEGRTASGHMFDQQLPFRVESEYLGAIVATVSGSPLIRPNRARPYDILLSNYGNVDAPLVLVVVVASDSSLTLEPQFPTEMLAMDGSSLGESSNPSISGPRGKAFVFLEPVVPVGEASVVKRFLVSASAELSGSEIELRALVLPLAESGSGLRASAATPCVRKLVSFALQGVISSVRKPWHGQSPPGMEACIDRLLIESMEAISENLTSGNSIDQVVASWSALNNSGDLFSFISNLMSASFLEEMDGAAIVADCVGLSTDDVLQFFADRVLPEIIKKLIPFVGQAAVACDLLETMKECFPSYVSYDCSDGWRAFKMFVVNSLDPNEIVGPEGVGPHRCVRASSTLDYAIHFENKSSATAPAQFVTVMDTLSTASFDLDRIELSAFVLGDSVYSLKGVAVGDSCDFDLRPGLPLVVRLRSTLLTSAGIMTWSFSSIDPVTGLPTEDVLLGFLPPNVLPPQGEAAILFSIGISAEAQDTQTLENRATIVFDDNWGQAIRTNVWSNRVDDSPPASSVTQVTSSDEPGTFEISWAGMDDGAGVESYSVYVSEDEGPFDEWALQDLATSGLFRGVPGKTYSFYSVAVDALGLREDDPLAGDLSSRWEFPEGDSTHIRLGPNPTSGGCRIEFVLPRRTTISLKVHDVRGRVVKSLFDGDAQAVSQAVLWDGKDSQGRSVAAGAYFVRLVHEFGETSTKVLLVR